MKNKKIKKMTNYDKHLMEILKDRKLAIEFIKASLEDDDMPELFLVSLRKVAEANGITKIAKKTSLSKENLYKMLSVTGNPGFYSVRSILQSLGLKLSVELKIKNKLHHI